MKLQIMSDIHLDHLCDEYDPEVYDEAISFTSKVVPGADTLVLAGDIGPIHILKPFLKDMEQRFQSIIFVPGNHDYWYMEPLEAIEKFKELENGQTKVLVSGELITLEDQRFIGGTMWFPEPKWKRDKINDFFLIRKFEPWVYDEHLRFRDFLKGNLQKGDIVITHHLPHSGSIAPQYQRSDNRWFYAPMEGFIYDVRPRLWIHGHTHEGCAYEAAPGAYVVCNPKGYPSERSNYVNNLAIDLEDEDPIKNFPYPQNIDFARKYDW